jgi:hypothetical protein
MDRQANHGGIVRTTKAKHLPTPGTRFAAVYQAVLAGATTIDEIAPLTLATRTDISVCLRKLYLRHLISRSLTGNALKSGKPVWKYNAKPWKPARIDAKGRKKAVDKPTWPWRQSGAGPHYEPVDWPAALVTDRLPGSLGRSPQAE